MLAFASCRPLAKCMLASFRHCFQQVGRRDLMRREERNEKRECDEWSRTLSSLDRRTTGECLIAVATSTGHSLVTRNHFSPCCKKPPQRRVAWRPRRPATQPAAERARHDPRSASEKNHARVVLCDFEPVMWVVVALVPFSFLVLTWAWKRFSSPNNLPPGPPCLPLLGSLLSLGSDADVSAALSRLGKRYGVKEGLFHFCLGERPAVCVTSAEMLAHVVRVKGRDSSGAFSLTTFGGADIALAPYGEAWRGRRKFIHSALLSQSRQSLWEASLEASLEALTDVLQRAGEKKGAGKKKERSLT